MTIYDVWCQWEKVLEMELATKENVTIQLQRRKFSWPFPSSLFGFCWCNFHRWCWRKEVCTRCAHTHITPFRYPLFNLPDDFLRQIPSTCRILSSRSLCSTTVLPQDLGREENYSTRSTRSSQRTLLSNGKDVWPHYYKTSLCTCSLPQKYP